MEEEKKPLVQEDTTPKKETKLSGFFKLKEDVYRDLCDKIFNTEEESKLFEHPLVKNIGDSEIPIYMIMTGMIVTNDGYNIHFFPVYINVSNYNYVIGSSIYYDELPKDCRTNMVLEQDFEEKSESVTYSEYEEEWFLHYEYGTRVIEYDKLGNAKLESFLRLINLNSKTLIQLI